MTSERGRRALLTIAAAGAVLVMLDLATLVNFVAVAAIILCAAVTPPGGGGVEPIGRSWWSMLMLGAALCLIGVPIELALEGIGGLLTLIGGVLVVLAVALGFPLRPGGDGAALGRG